jgi:hypothetical protein
MLTLRALVCVGWSRLISEPARAEYFEALCEATFRGVSMAGESIRTLPIRVPRLKWKLWCRVMMTIAVGWQCMGLEDPGFAGEGMVRLASSLSDKGHYTVFIKIVPLNPSRHMDPLPMVEEGGEGGVVLGGSIGKDIG